MGLIENKVNQLNKSYCVNTHNHLVILRNYGLFRIVLTGKNKKIGIGNKQFGITTWADKEVTYNCLKKVESWGWLQEVISYNEN